MTFSATLPSCCRSNLIASMCCLNLSASIGGKHVDQGHNSGGKWFLAPGSRAPIFLVCSLWSPSPYEENRLKTRFFAWKRQKRDRTRTTLLRYAFFFPQQTLWSSLFLPNDLPSAFPHGNIAFQAFQNGITAFCYNRPRNTDAKVLNGFVAFWPSYQPCSSYFAQLRDLCRYQPCHYTSLRGAYSPYPKDAE